MENSKQHEIFAKLEKSFQVTDHWHFETSGYEKIRLQTILEMCKNLPHASILEIGCAEGHFTELLCEISNNVTAIDLSATAITRAKQRAPAAKFFNQTLGEFEIPAEKYDLIVCSEMLYYLLDQKAAIKKIKLLGRYLVTSHFLMNKWRAYISEYYLLRFKNIKRKMQFSITERKLTLFGAWKL